ncbi:sugar transferase [Gordonia westfalica]|uniref:Exopolysaccharide biosynthesis polyprenyl glycosylphosphotransferase n=1 Tax=Gordonia westfalica TaxID=158898 RepID=A0A1H2LUG7_9ACTN|nr:exopolysaccharide biosynthesis polyprenyl glycosylphosphotransferase [Gordonia westfalica]
MATRTPEVEIAPVRARSANSPQSRRSLGDLIRDDPLSTIVTVSIDLVSAIVATGVAIFWIVNRQPEYPPLWTIGLYPLILVGIFGLRKTYRRGLNRRFLDEVGKVMTGCTVAAMILLCSMLLSGLDDRPGAAVTKLWVSAIFWVPLGRLIRDLTQRRLRRHGHLMAPTLIIGDGPVTEQVVGRMVVNPEHGLKPVGVLAAGAPARDRDERVSEIPHLGGVDDLDDAIRATDAEILVVAFAVTNVERLTASVRIAHRHGVKVWIVPRMFDVVGRRSRVDHIGGLPLMSVPHTNPRGWQFRAKHIGDRVTAALILTAIAPLFLTLMLLVRLSSPGPIFFAQPRVGRDGRVFDCLKFRSMRPEDPDAEKFRPVAGSAPGGVEGVDRRTWIGKIMRSTSMDELPQLLNVFRGEMSLVGPRPERPEYVSLFEVQIRRYGERHRVKAGVTGWAQVHGLRGQTSIADRAEWDNYYIENWSLWLDVKILLLTVLAVLKRAE